MIRRCLESDIPLLSQLFAKVHPANPRLQERDFIDWQFRDNPLNHSEGYTLFCSWEGSSISGFVGYSPVDVWVDGCRHDGCWIQEWYAQRGAVGLALLGQVMSLYDHRLIVGITLDAFRVYEAYKIPMLDRLPRWTGIIDPEIAAIRFDIGDEASLELMYASAETLRGRRDTSRIYHCDRFDPDVEFRFDRWSSIKGYAGRTGEYLNWRYFDIPRHNYRAIGGPNGQFAVYRVEKMKGFEESVVRILEWNFWGDSAGEAVQTILQEGQREGAILMDFFCTSSEVAEGLEDAGFVPSTSFATTPIPYLFRPLHHTAEGIRVAIDLPPHRRDRHVAFNEWYITKGDSDMDRIKV